MKKHGTVDQYLAATVEWKTELAELRSILLSTGLEETIKWGGPVYTHRGKNVVGLGGFKSYFGLWFFQGALLADRKKRLVNAQEGRTRALRQLRFGSRNEIDRKLIGAYVEEAIGLVEKGVEIKPERGKPLRVPAELERALAEHAGARAGFSRLSPGRKREYADFVASAKKAETRERRVRKVLPLLAEGVGLNDRYR